MIKQYDQTIRRQAIVVLVRGISGLQFEAALEQKFTTWYSFHYLAINRIYLLVSALAMAILTMADQIIAPEITDQLLTVRVPTILFIGLIFVASHLRFVVPHMLALLFLVACTVHFSLLVTASYAALAGHSYYQSSTIISVVFACLVLRLRFHYVLPLAFLLWFSQVMGTHFFMALSFAEFIELFTVYTVITLLALVVCFRTEYDVRRNFIMQVLISKKNHQQPHLPSHAKVASSSNPDRSNEPGNEQNVTPSDKSAGKKDSTLQPVTNAVLSQPDP